MFVFIRESPLWLQGTSARLIPGIPGTAGKGGREGGREGGRGSKIESKNGGRKQENNGSMKVVHCV